MQYDRRQALRRLGVASVAVLASSSPLIPARAATPRVRTALLVPLSGPSAALGLALQRAATLAYPMGKADDILMTFDTAGSGAAAAAARDAMRKGAKLILGPLFAADVRPVLAEVRGRAPVLSFSNDLDLRESGAFLLGLTASQSVSAILSYARSRGIRSVGIVQGDSAWARQANLAAQAMRGQIGIDLAPIAAGTPVDLLSRQAGAVDALLMPEGGNAFTSAARALRDSGVQLLGTHLAVDYAPQALAAMEGAWLASPPPDAFADFARSYGARHGGTPGAVAALGYDGARIGAMLAAAGRVDRGAVLALQGFSGATGALRFRSDGSCVRDMSILVAGANGYDLVQTLPSA